MKKFYDTIDHKVIMSRYKELLDKVFENKFLNILIKLFDFMPAKGQQTFRPALVSGDKVLKRGLASGGNQ